MNKLIIAYRRIKELEAELECAKALIEILADNTDIPDLPQLITHTPPETGWQDNLPDKTARVEIETWEYMRERAERQARMTNLPRDTDKQAFRHNHIPSDRWDHLDHESKVQLHKNLTQRLNKIVITTY